MMYAAQEVAEGNTQPAYALMNNNLKGTMLDAEVRRGMQMLGGLVWDTVRSNDGAEFNALIMGEEAGVPIKETGKVKTGKYSLPAAQKQLGNVLNMTWDEQVDEINRIATDPGYKTSIPSQSSFVMGGTPKALQDIGFSSLPMTMDLTHAIQAINGKNGDQNHKLGPAMLKQLPELMENPIAVFASKDKGDTSAMVIVQGTVNGAQEVAVLRISTTTRLGSERYDVNHMVTVQGRGNAANLLMDALAKENKNQIALYSWDKAKATALMNGHGLQLPQSSPADGFVHNIHDPGSPVKMEKIEQTDTKQFGRWFGNSVATKNGKVNGEPITLYHQTEAEIDVFDPKHKGAGTSDTETPHGIFLKPTNDDIGLKGKHQMALYARIEHPLTFENRAAAVKWYEDHVEGYTEARKEAMSVDERYNKRYKALEKESDDWYKAHWKEVRANQISEEEFEKGSKKKEIDALFTEWHEAGIKAAEKAKAILDEYFAGSEYDGIHLLEDAGSFGRKIETWIAFKSNQVKSADKNQGTFDLNNQNNKYSLSDLDEDYSAAVESGNEQKQRELVEQAAREAGYDTESYNYLTDTIESIEGKSYRGVEGNAVSSSWGHAMFTDDAEKAYAPDHGQEMQARMYSVDKSKLTDIDELKKDIEDEFCKAVEEDLLYESDWDITEFAEMDPEEFSANNKWEQE